VPRLIDCCVLRAFRGLPLARQPFVRFIVYSLMAGTRPWILFLLMLLTRPALVPVASSLFADIRVGVVRRIDFLWSSPLLVDSYIAIIAFTITSPCSIFPSIASAITNSSARSCLHRAFAGSSFLWPVSHQRNELLRSCFSICHRALLSLFCSPTQLPSPPSPMSALFLCHRALNALALRCSLGSSASCLRPFVPLGFLVCLEFPSKFRRPSLASIFSPSL
jgi:hypothetical protein